MVWCVAITRHIIFFAVLLAVPFSLTKAQEYKQYQKPHDSHTLLVVSHSQEALHSPSRGLGAFALVDGGAGAAPIYVSSDEALVVHKAVGLFADDVERVSTQKPHVSNWTPRLSNPHLTKQAETPQGDTPTAVGRKTSPSSSAVFVATLGRNAGTDAAIADAGIDVTAIRGGWEQFIVKVSGRRLFVVGSDSRGTAYGLLTLSQAIGVSPWYWWADVPVSRHNALYLDADYTSPSPSVKYRGFFINDEDWGLKPWASENYEKELGDIGPRTYARVCELLLRLMGNMLAPAMHSCTGAFYSHPGNKVVADSFGIIITTSHCEPLLFNNAAKSEWDEKLDGDWNYKTNSQTIYKKWDDRLAEASQYENIYTTAMRGLHDAGLRGNLPMSERVPLIEQVINDQRELLARHHPALKPEQIPQIFVPYKETMEIYMNGLRVPDDITLVWVDDNYGYMKRVANPEEQKRSGRSGVYYHLSYLGAPHDYLWLNTTPPVLMYEELKKAYDNGADRYWLLNVGDIKPMELGTQTFFDMAWNIGHDHNGGFSFEDAYHHQARFLARSFPQLTFKNTQDTTQPQDTFCQRGFSDILDDYYRLAWSRKPEFMGWDYEWDDNAHTGLKDTEFSFKNYGEAQRRLADYQLISDEVERLAVSGLPADTALRAAFFQLLQFPVQGACQMNRKFLMAQLNHELAAEGRYAEANWAARQMEEAYDSINALNSRYNKLLNGKWDGMMALATSFTNTCLYYQKPEVKRFEGAGEQPVALTPDNCSRPKDCQAVDLTQYDHQRCSDDVRLIKGLGYDGHVLQLGNPSKPVDNNMPDFVEYSINAGSDTIDVVIYTVPFWPLYEGRPNRIGASVDGSPVQIFENKFKEYDRTWKDQVMRNGAVCRMRFAVDKHRDTNRLRIYGDPGQMVQRIIIDSGGLLPSYLGPQN